VRFYCFLKTVVGQMSLINPLKDKAQTKVATAIHMILKGHHGSGFKKVVVMTTKAAYIPRTSNPHLQN
jgi:hypothetical protein